jgi:UDPglucose 6-dehydrogenase
MIKQASSTYLATRISFINAIANVCEAVGADVRDVALGMGYDPRIGSDFLHPGPGFGGACLPKDTAALLHTAAQFDYDFSLLRGVLDVNERQREHMIDAIRTMAGGDLAGKRIAVLGLTFKANTDDLRDSPAMTVEALVADGAQLRVYDPVAAADADRRPPASSASPTLTTRRGCVGRRAAHGVGGAEDARLPPCTRRCRRHAVVDARNLLARRRYGCSASAYQGIGR